MGMGGFNGPSSGQQSLNHKQSSAMGRGSNAPSKTKTVLENTRANAIDSFSISDDGKN